MNKKMEPLICEISSGNLETKYGKFRIHYFTDGREDAVALVKGDDIVGEKEVLCRIHSQCFFAEAFYSTECDCSEQMELALENIQAQGGILIYLFQNGRGYGLAPLISTQDLKERGINQKDAYEYKGFYGIERPFDMAAKILLHFKIKSIKLITKNKAKIDGMEKYGITVSDAGLNSSVVILDKKITNYINYKQIEIMPVTDNSVIIISDLNIDKILCLTDCNGEFCGFNDGIKETTGGCAFNSAQIFKQEHLDPVILGSIGDDPEGRSILSDLENNELKAFIYKSSRQTGKSQIFYRNDSREIFSERENANDYDSRISVMLDSLKLNGRNIIYATTHMLIRGTEVNVKKISESMYSSGARIVIDIVPHDIYNSATWDTFCKVFDRPLFMVICELKTILSFHPDLNHSVGYDETVEHGIFQDVLEKVYDSRLDMEYFVLRYGYQNIGKQRVYKKKDGKFIQCVDEETGFENVKPEDRRGYGEVLTANLLKKYHYGVENDH